MSYSIEPEEMLGRQIYALYLAGKDDHTIAIDLDMDVATVTAVRERFVAHVVDTQPEDPEARAKWRERIEVWIARLDLAYEGGRVNIERGVNAFTKLASLGIDLDGLAAAKKLDVNMRGSKVDQDIEALLGQFPADVEEDRPL